MIDPICPLCKRVLVSGPSIDEHHLVPRSVKKNDDTITIHKICHRKIHSLFTEKELGLVYNTIDKLIEHPEIQKFVRWVSKKHPEYYDSSRESRERKNKRRR